MTVQAASSLHPGKGPYMTNCFSIADEVVDALGAAEIGPALRAPIFDEACVAHECLEAVPAPAFTQVPVAEDRSKVANLKA